MIILDTNIVSALMRREPTVLRWMESVPEDELFSAAIARAEIRYGLAKLPGGRRRDGLMRDADVVMEEFSDRWLPFDHHAADRFGTLVAERERAGRPMQIPDAQIASIAFVRRASLATRNVRDFEDCGVRLLNPYDA